MTVGAPNELEKAHLSVIQATHASLGGMKQSGVLQRHTRTLRAYAESFDVTVFSADVVDFSGEIGVPHVPVPWLPRTGGLRHVVFYLWLVVNARRMRGTIRVFGSNIPTLPLVKALSKARLVVSYQFDYAGLAAETHGRGSTHATIARIAEWLSLRTADLVPATTPSLAATVERRYRRPTVLLPNWVDVSQVPVPPAGRTPGAILYAGRLHRIKGVEVLIDAFSEVSSTHPLATLTVCGSGEEEAALRRRVVDRRVKRVTFAGRLENHKVLERMAEAEVFVLPTLTSEGHPKALLEGMASGTACIASAVPGNRDAIEADVTGLLVAPGNSEALADALGRLLSDGALRERLGTAAAEATKDLSFATLIARDIEGLSAAQPRSTHLAGISAVPRKALRMYSRLPWKPLHRQLHSVYAWYRARDRRPSVIATIGGVTYDLDLRQYIDASIYRLGCFEPETADLIRRVVKPGMIAIDVGANMGAHALPMARLVGKGGRVIAFEPMRPPREKMERNARLNDFGASLEIVPMGLADEPQTVTGAFRTSSSFYGDDDEPAIQEVTLMRLDDFLAGRESPWVDFIKLDVDGFELKVLRGARGTLLRCHPALVTEISHWTLARTGDTAEELICLLTEAGYSFFVGPGFKHRVSFPELVALAPTKETTIDVFCRASDDQ